MKQSFLFTIVIAAFLFAGIPTIQADDHQHAKHAKQSATVNLDQQYRLKGVLLFGEYLVVHDDDAKERGEDCVFFYKVKDDGTKVLAASYHCKAITRTKAEKFSIVAQRRTVAWGIPEIEEIQFAGSSEGHRVS